MADHPGDHHPALPPDQADRDVIRNDLDRNLLVEAAAGTGKTTSMVDRMVEILARGKCGIEKIAAVTFTRKAAAELRTRFQAEMEKAVGAGNDRPRPQRERLARALAHVDTSFIGTIHSFCGRILRERPVEAEVDIEFLEVDEKEDGRLRREAWDIFMAEFVTSEDPVFERLRCDLLDVDVWAADLMDGFMRFANYPDVGEWPAPVTRRPPLEPAVAALTEYTHHMRAVAAGFGHPGTDELMPLYRRIPKMMSQNDLGTPGDVLEIMECFRKRKMVQKWWPGGQKGGMGKDEEKRWNEFTARIAAPFVQQFLESRYEPVVRVFRKAREVYDRLRAERGVLNFQDLLMRAAALLRTNPHVRRYFRNRFSCLLVDEFQDTDPIQAEVILLLTAADHGETDWKKCVPVPGSLFVVGDPKQSIYRFRRADIVTYNEVKAIIVNHGGRIASLTANFRTVRPVQEWVNTVFGTDSVFPAGADRYSPAYVPLDPGRTDGTPGPDLEGVRVIRIPAPLKKKDDIRAWEPGVIARIIRHLVDTGVHVPRTRREVEMGVAPEAGFGDFLIITRKKEALSLYGRALQRLGIPHQVTGGHAMNDVSEIELLHRVLRAALHPDDGVALVALLRSGLFGFSDEELYAFRRADGRFSFRKRIPDALEREVAGRFKVVFDRLKGYAGWLLRFPPVPAMEKIAMDLGLFVRAAASEEGNSLAGGLAKAFEILRAGQAGFWSAAEVVAELGRIAAQEDEYDGVAARPSSEAVVRVMNLHKVKGLEAPVVFLADPVGSRKYSPDVHVDRSSGEVCGYIPVNEPRNKNTFAGGKVLVVPPGWKAFAEEEEMKFLEAEETRLLYVAATRAGSQLVVVQNGRNTNPWNFFGPWLQGVPEVADPGERPVPVVDAKTLTAEEVEASGREIAARWATVRTATYASIAAKEAPPPAGVAVPEAMTSGDAAALHVDLPLPDPDQSTGWGTVIHNLLEAALLDSSVDLAPLAASCLDEEGIDRCCAETALFLVNRVIRSAVWKRARGARCCLTEVPLQILLPEDDVRSAAAPTLLKGVVDLVFEEEDGWVIVDWKTDRISGRDLAAAAGRYGSQLANYRDAWERSTGQRVVETGIYFVMADEYVS